MTVGSFKEMKKFLMKCWRIRGICEEERDVFSKMKSREGKRESQRLAFPNALFHLLHGFSSIANKTEDPFPLHSLHLNQKLNISIMGLDVVFENENHFQTVSRTKIVNHPPRSRAKVDEKDIKALLKSRYYNLKLDESSRELRLSNSSSPRRKSMPARLHSAQAKKCEAVHRGSVYESSREIRSIRALTEVRRNVETSFSDEAFLSFDIVDPIYSIPRPSSNDSTAFPPPKRSPLMSSDTESTKCREFQELSFRDLAEECIKLSSLCSGSGQQMDSLKDDVTDGLRCKDQRGKVPVEEQKSDRENILSERDNRCNLPKSFSAKEVMFNSPHCTHSDKEISKASLKTRFSPFSKMLDPIMKSKSLRNPSLMETEIGSSIKRHRASPKSLLNDFSKATDDKNYDDGSTKREQISTMVSSAVRLHAILKLDCMQGTPSYKFAIKDRDDVLLAKTWRTDTAFNWVYTFHSSKKKNANRIGWKSKERHGHSPPMVGQMQVSCYLCSEISETGSLEGFVVTKFVLYDVAQARRGFTMGESVATHTPSEGSNSTETEKSQDCRSNDFDSDPSTSYPWALPDLHPYLEIIASVIRIPFAKKDMKEMQVEEGKIAKDTTFECTSRANVKVVVPRGTHGLPSNEEGSPAGVPASLLDRWRFGGGCDCGGWDMACPIVVLDNTCDNDEAKGDQQQMALFVQGRKEKIPVLSITADGNGQYVVDFHAQLSSLQAFSICISILHSSESASALSHENKQGLYTSSLKLLLEEEVRHLLEAIAEEEERKTKNKIEQLSQSFILDLPFSPMGRV